MTTEQERNETAQREVDVDALLQAIQRDTPRAIYRNLCRPARHVRAAVANLPMRLNSIFTTAAAPRAIAE